MMRIRGSAVLVAIGAIAGSSAMADEVPPPKTGDEVESIVVSANKRDEAAEKVPVSLVAITAATATEIGITDVSSLQTDVPGLEFPREFGGATPALRGIGTNTGLGGQESVVAMYIDDVYIASPVATTFTLNNIAQVEVLKGPQGTIFGRNAMAGVIDIKTDEPAFEPSGKVSVGYANYNTPSASGYVTGPITDRLAIDLAASYSDQQSGWGKNLFLDTSAFTERDWDGRSKLLYKADDDTTLTLAADYTRSRYSSGIAMLPVPGSLFPDGQRFEGWYNVDEDPTGFVDTKQGGVSLKIDHDFGFARLLSISAWRQVRSYNHADEDQSRVYSQDLFIDDKRDTYSEELRLLSEPSDELNWILGAFYFNDDSFVDPFTDQGLALGSASSEITETFRQRIESYAAFGQGTVTLPYEAHLTLGARYTFDSLRADGTEAFDGFPIDQSYSHAHDSAFTYKINLAKDIGSNTMIYAGYSTGFKGGIYNLSNINAPPVSPEHLDDTEVGFKSELFDRKVQVNGAFFYYTYRDLQVATLTEADGRTFQDLQNAAEAESKGFDLDFVVKATPALTLRGGLEFLSAHFTKFPDATISVPLPGGGNTTTPGNAAGNALPHAPDFTGNIGGQYRVTSDAGDFLLALNYYYNGGFSWDADNRLKQAAYHIVNGSVTWMSDDGDWELQLWGKNLANQKYSIYTTANIVGDEQSPAPPLTFGGTLTRNF